MSMHSGGTAARGSAARTAASVVAALVLAACGAAPQEPPAEAPASPAAMQAGSGQPQRYGAQPGEARPAYPAAPSAEALTRDDAAGELEQAEAEIYAALGRSGFAEPPPKPAATPGSQPVPRPVTAPKAGEIEAAAKPPGHPCATACRALASMNRAADHLCGLAGESDARCSDARTRVKSASDRVHTQCPACAP